MECWPLLKTIWLHLAFFFLYGWHLFCFFGPPSRLFVWQQKVTGYEQLTRPFVSTSWVTRTTTVPLCCDYYVSCRCGLSDHPGHTSQTLCPIPLPTTLSYDTYCWNPRMVRRHSPIKCSDKAMGLFPWPKSPLVGGAFHCVSNWFWRREGRLGEKLGAARLSST